MELAIDSGSEDCLLHNEFYEIHCNKNEIYNIKTKLENKIKNFISTEIEWIPLNYIEISDIDKKDYLEFIENLEDDDDIQNIYSNAKI